MSDAIQTQETVTATIDGREVTVPKGTTILQACEGMGTRVPHYCYQDGLSAPAQCRLCLVEVTGAPKLQASCVTMVTEGQTVLTQSEQALEARKGVLDFYLTNHPLDCPICDQSGECYFQDYVHAEGPAHQSSKEPKRVFGRDDFGGDVLFYGDRCVMCTRCVRFMNEMAQDPRLAVVERGNRSIIDTFFEEGLEGSPYAGNIVDICPVGALVSKDFLHKARAWDLDRIPSICPNCSQGCNIELHVRDERVQRLKPRTNADVNAHWMCDYGRGRYEWLNREDRIEAPLVRANEGFRAVDWPTALTAAAEGLRDAGAVKALASPFASNEELAALRALVDTLGGGEIVFRTPMADEEIPLPGFSRLARRKELAPNATGARFLGMVPVGDADGRGGLEGLAGHTGVLITLGDELADAPEGFGADAAFHLHLGYHPSAGASSANLVLPLTTFVESEGSFTNHEGRIQRFFAAVPAQGAARPGWWALGALLAALTEGNAPASPDEAFERAGAVAPQFAGITYTQIGTRGAPANEPVALPGS